MATLFRLYFGRSIIGGYVVADNDWEDFENEHIKPYLESYTVHHGLTGVWSGSREETTVLEVITSDNPESIKGGLQKIAQSYCYDFSQEAVVIAEFECNFDLITTD